MLSQFSWKRRKEGRKQVRKEGMVGASCIEEYVKEISIKALTRL